MEQELYKNLPPGFKLRMMGEPWPDNFDPKNEYRNLPDAFYFMPDEETQNKLRSHLGRFKVFDELVCVASGAEFGPHSPHVNYRTSDLPSGVFLDNARPKTTPLRLGGTYELKGFGVSQGQDIVNVSPVGETRLEILADLSERTYYGARLRTDPLFTLPYWGYRFILAKHLMEKDPRSIDTQALDSNDVQDSSVLGF